MYFAKKAEIEEMREEYQALADKMAYTLDKVLDRLTELEQRVEVGSVRVSELARERAQYDNLFAYDGSARGQRRLPEVSE